MRRGILQRYVLRRPDDNAAEGSVCVNQGCAVVFDGLYQRGGAGLAVVEDKKIIRLPEVFCSVPAVWGGGMCRAGEAQAVSRTQSSRAVVRIWGTVEAV